MNQAELMHEIRKEMCGGESSPYDWKRGDLHCRKRWDTIDIETAQIVHHVCKYKRYHHGGFHVCRCGEKKMQLTRSMMQKHAKKRAAYSL